MSKSLNILYGEELKELGYTKSNVNHFQKKFKNHWFYVDKDLDTLLLRILKINIFKETKCIESKSIPLSPSLTKFEFATLIFRTENEFAQLIKNYELSRNY